MIGVLLTVIGLAMLVAHRPLAAYFHEVEGRRRDVLGGEMRARLITLLCGAAFSVGGTLVLIGVWSG